MATISTARDMLKVIDDPDLLYWEESPHGKRP